MAYNEKLWFLILFKSSLCLLTFVVIWLVHYRLYHYSYEGLSSYLGFDKLNWNFLLLWTIIFISLHSFQWANHTQATHIRLSEDILTYGLWATLDAFQSERIALVLSSAVFAFTHYNFDPTAVIFYFISSFIFVSARTTGGHLPLPYFCIFYTISPWCWKRWSSCQNNTVKNFKSTAKSTLGVGCSHASFEATALYWCMIRTLRRLYS
ncbi:type II CAAX prenyl endopeptidase Rce1 family protein [Moraxella lacunata]|uniref:type II CAAX prenyl endopeptidase Rce1 family protein n=1 Tax=Moraxella lacunata TaxID=477 RepID=UPI0011C026EF|nr:CPBP family glutamic-type intramembrane protease [Moraxella lacunata]